MQTGNFQDFERSLDISKLGSMWRFLLTKIFSRPVYSSHYEILSMKLLSMLYFEGKHLVTVRFVKWGNKTELLKNLWILSESESVNPDCS